jgi:hypothetical protein
MLSFRSAVRTRTQTTKFVGARRAAYLLCAVAIAALGVVVLPTAAFAAAPDAPTIGTATASAGAISVSFTPPLNNGGNTITNYTATCVSSDVGATGVTSGATSPIVVSPLTNGSTYTCTVNATNVDGTGPDSSASNTAVPATLPSAPTAPAATPAAGAVSVSFGPPNDNGGSAVTGYTAECDSSDGGISGLVGGATSPILVSPLSNGHTYTCTVTATNAVGTGGPTGQTNSVVVPAVLPGPPTINSVTPGNGQVSVDFAPPSDDGGSAITNYEATCLSSDGGAADIEDSPTSPILVGPLSNGNNYSCTVTATNGVGMGPASTPSSVFVPATVPGAPNIGVATGGLGSVSVAFSISTDGGSPITSFTATCTSSTGGVSGNASGPVTPVVVTGLTNGANYTCSVTATNSVGTSGPSRVSNVAVPAITIPDPPTIGTPISSNADVSVVFTPPANGGGSAITEFDASCISSNGGTPGTGTGSASPVDVTPLDNGKTYTCTVTAMNSVGTSQPSAASSPVIPLGPPVAPTINSVTSGVASVSVDFSPPSDNGGSAVTGYTASCTSSDTGVNGTVSGASTPIVVAPLTNGSSYTCTVTATNAIGTGVPSDPSDTVVPATVPDAPKIGTALPRVNSILVQSLLPAFDGGSPVTSETARCVPVAGGTVTTQTRIGPVTFFSVPAVPGLVYTCSVTASNAVGRSGASKASNQVSAATLPGAPTIGTATGGNASASVAFTPPLNNGGMAITSYTASCTSSNGGATGSATGAASPILVGSLTNAKNYTCTVQATNPVGTGAPSAASNAVTPNPVLPGAPTIGTATASPSAISVAFTPPANNGGSAIVSFTATCASSNGGATGSAAGAASPISVGSLTNGKLYTCTVTAMNGVGTGPASAASNAVTPNAVVPGAPTIGTATRLNNAASVAFTAPASTGGSPITSYAANCTSSNSGATGNASGAGSPIIVGGLSNGHTYRCTVKAINAVGPGPASAQSNQVIPATVPGAPVIGTVTPGNGSLTVAFAPPAINGGSTITSYTARCVSSNSGVAGSATGAASPLTVGSLTNAKTYTCSVTATNAVGQGAASAASPPIIAGTAIAPTGVTATAGSGSATVAWTAPANNNGSAVTGYVVIIIQGANQSSMTFNSTATSQMISGLTSGLPYSFKVAAINGRGTGPASAPSNTVTPT